MPQIQLKKQSSEHSPTLNTILMVEKVLEKDKDLLSVAEIKRRLPKKIGFILIVKNLRLR